MNSAEKAALAENFRSKARQMYFSHATIDHFLEEFTLGQTVAINQMLDYEFQIRDDNRRGRLMRKARFPVIKSVNAFDFSQIGFPENYTRDDLCSLDFIEHAQDFVFYGKTGRGKTHLAIGLGILSVNSGYQVRYFSTAELVLALGKAKREERLDQFLKDLEKAHLIILDEFGYVPFDIDGARLLYQLISKSYETRSMIFTTNIEFSKWGTIFADEKLAAATVDRIVHHGRLVEFNGPSHRMDKSLMLGKVQV